MSITVHDAARLTGLSPRTLRYYLRENLLPTVGRDQNGIHVFTEQDLQLILRVRFLRACGLPIQEIRRFVSMMLEGTGTLEDRKALLQAQTETLEEQLDALRDRLLLSRYLTWYYEQVMEDRDLAAQETPPFSDIREAFRRFPPCPEEHREAMQRSINWSRHIWRTLHPGEPED